MLGLDFDFAPRYLCTELIVLGLWSPSLLCPGYQIYLYLLVQSNNFNMSDLRATGHRQPLTHQMCVIVLSLSSLWKATLGNPSKTCSVRGFIDLDLQSDRFSFLYLFMCHCKASAILFIFMKIQTDNFFEVLPVHSIHTKNPIWKDPSDHSLTFWCFKNGTYLFHLSRDTIWTQELYFYTSWISLVTTLYLISE